MSEKYDFEVPVTIKLDDGTFIEEHFIVTAHDEVHAVKKAKALARFKHISSDFEDKTLGLLPSVSWWKFWRVRQYERGAKHALSYCGVNSGYLLKAGIAQSKKLLKRSKRNDTDNAGYSTSDLQRFQRNCLISSFLYVALLIVSLYLIIKGGIFTFLSGTNHAYVYLLSGLISALVFGLLTFRSMKDYREITNELKKNGLAT